MSISTCSMKSNPNISLSGSEVNNLKNSMNYQLSNSIALPSQIIIYYCNCKAGQKISNSTEFPIVKFY